MDKEIIRQYCSLVKEVEDEEKRIFKMEQELNSMLPQKNDVTDVVTRGKKGKKPLGICVIQGNEDYDKINREQNKLRGKKAKRELLVTQLKEFTFKVEDYIDSLEESEIRRILRFKYIHGTKEMSWSEIAKHMGDGYTAESCKQKHSRFMRVK